MILRRIYNLLLSPEKDFTRSLRLILGFTPRNLSLYHQAFHHASISQEGAINNERLELLGDSVLNMIIADLLFRKFPNRREGFMTEMRSKIVSRSQMNEIAFQMALPNFIRRSHSIRNLRENDLLGNALEALIGAVYLDAGYKGARRFVLDKMIAPHLNISELEKIDYNFKSKLINWAQSNKKVCSFKVLDEKRADHRILYKIAAFVDDVSYGESESFNKKQAEQQSAELACKALGI